MTGPDSKPDSFDDADEARLPARLAADLQALYAAGVRVPASVDEAVLAAARARLATIRRWRLVLRWGGGAAAAAAVVLVALRLLPHSVPQPAAPTPLAVQLREDLNHDGRVDILDAYFLARQIKAGAPPRPEWDVNGDGLVDQKDVDAVANAAVRVGLAQGGPHKGGVQ